jgi:phospholipid transport system substrate-binding protein
MAQKAVGAGWTKLTPAQQQSVTEAFHRYMTATYADRFDSYSGEKFQVRGVEPTSFGTIVQSQIVKSDGAPVSINYLMHENSGAWQIADVYLTGTISQLANLRSQFSAVLARQGVDGLIAMLNEKAETLVANNKS